MKLAVITHVAHTKNDKEFYAYGPYVREMNIWFRHVSEVTLVAPHIDSSPDLIDLPYVASKLTMHPIPSLYFKNFKNFLRSIFALPTILYRLFAVMRDADHIHLRCPGNIGLLGCLVQILFPKKKKSAKYAGNWDPNSKQPLSYKLQKWILSNTFLTKNMQVLVYGEWPNQTKNIVPFFTATYRETEKVEVPEKKLESVMRLIFVGTLSAGKRPLYSLELVRKFVEKGHDVHLDVYGEGIERIVLQDFIEKNNLQPFVTLQGNQNEATVRKAYQQAHFLVLPSKSEGWPKVVAEAMFWRCLPVATPVSCVSNMLDDGERGILLTMDLEHDAKAISNLWFDKEKYHSTAKKAQIWSQHYTLDLFEAEIKKIITT